jgi:hypothetical protein
MCDKMDPKTLLWPSKEPITGPCPGQSNSVPARISFAEHPF